MELICIAIIVFLIWAFSGNKSSDNQSRKETTQESEARDYVLERATDVIFRIYSLKLQKESESIAGGSVEFYKKQIASDVSLYCYRFFVDDIIVWNTNMFQATPIGIVSDHHKIYFGQNNSYYVDQMIRINEEMGYVDIRGKFFISS